MVVGQLALIIATQFRKKIFDRINLVFRKYDKTLRPYLYVYAKAYNFREIILPKIRPAPSPREYEDVVVHEKKIYSQKRETERTSQIVVHVYKEAHSIGSVRLSIYGLPIYICSKCD